jgi:hypothetical protein
MSFTNRTIKNCLSVDTKTAIVHAIRDWAAVTSSSNNKDVHISTLDYVINHGQKSAQNCYNFVVKRLARNLDIDHEQVGKLTRNQIINLTRRAIGKGGEVDTTSKPAIDAFNSWTNPGFKKTSVKTAGVLTPTHTVNKSSVSNKKLNTLVDGNDTNRIKTANMIATALTNTKFTASELITQKYTVPELLERIGLSVVL